MYLVLYNLSIILSVKSTDFIGLNWNSQDKQIGTHLDGTHRWLKPTQSLCTQLVITCCTLSHRPNFSSSSQIFQSHDSLPACSSFLQLSLSLLFCFLDRTGACLKRFLIVKSYFVNSCAFYVRLRLRLRGSDFRWIFGVLIILW